MTGRIMKGIGGFYYVYVEGHGLYECRAKGIFRNKKIKPNVGDFVDIDVISEDKKEGNLVKIHERKNQLIRPMVTNVDQALVVFAAHEPEPDFHLLNRFLIMMEQQNVPVVIGFNKMDLADASYQDRLREDYKNSGCGLVFFSTIDGRGMDEIDQILDGKTTVLAGPSGVGKSSTLNIFTGEGRMETGCVSEKIKRGRHTTRHSELIYLKTATYLLDTPGFSSLYLDGLEKEDLRYYFPEFTDYNNACRFNGCLHIHEPDCAVKEALAQGKISRLRYDDYCLFFEEVKSIKKW